MLLAGRKIVQIGPDLHPVSGGKVSQERMQPDDVVFIATAAGFLTRDSRVVERKKYGKAKARRSFQFSKR